MFWSSGVAAVGGDGDLALDGLNAGKALHELAASLVCLMDVACKGADNLMLAVEHHVEHKGKVSHLGSGKHVLAHVVVAQVAGTRMGIVHKLTVVVVHDGLVAGDARQDGLAATRETGKEVRLNKALGKQQIAIGGNLVDDALATRRQGADLFIMLSSVATCITISSLATISSPYLLTSSSCVDGRCIPVATKMRTRASGAAEWM